MGWLWPGDVIPVQKDPNNLKDGGEEKVRLGDLGPTHGSVSYGAFWLRSCSWLTYCLPKFRAPHCGAPPNERRVPTSWIWPWLWDLTCFGQWQYRRKWCVLLLGEAKSQCLVQTAMSFFLCSVPERNCCPGNPGVRMRQDRAAAGHMGV